MIGIDRISLYAPPFYLPMATLACARGVDAAKYHDGIGQEAMACLPPDEDVVTMAANAAAPIMPELTPAERARIRLVVVATESGIDASKSAAMYVHGLLGLPAACRAVEIKQACYSGTFALQSARALLADDFDGMALVICSDVAKYALNAPGEATQGAGAVAMLIAHNARIAAPFGRAQFHAQEVMDFWRPNYSTTAMVDGPLSTRMYLQSLQQCAARFCSENDIKLADFKHFCFHLPFTRMAEKALARLFKDKPARDARIERAAPTQRYNRVLGNTYTASLYIALASLLDNADDSEPLDNARVAMFSYGSGFVAEFFALTIAPGYAAQIANTKAHHAALLACRHELTYKEYLDFYQYALPSTAGTHTTPTHTSGSRYRLTGISDHQRQYQAPTHS